MVEPQVAVYILTFLGIVFSIVVHECAHGIVAYWCGDPTAYRMGRITLNPIPHIDPIMTILIPAVLMWSGGPVFGGARPVPVIPYNLRDPKRDMMWVAWAGPISNIILAVLFALTSNCVVIVNLWDTHLAKNLVEVFQRIVFANLFLAAFNFLPIPPLDGSKILAGLLPDEIGNRLLNIPTLHGFIIIWFVLLSGVLTVVLSPVIQVWIWIWSIFTFY